jgi:hypothetical protein
MVYCELGRLPLYVERQCKMAKYWTKVMNTENCILKGCYDDCILLNKPKTAFLP